MAGPRSLASTLAPRMRCPALPNFCCLDQAPFIEVVKVLHHARVPIIKAVASSDGGSESGDKFRVNIDISVDGPTHTGLATSAFVSYLADHLPNLVPLTIVLKSLLQVLLVPGLTSTMLFCIVQYISTRC